MSKVEVVTNRNDLEKALGKPKRRPTENKSIGYLSSQVSDCTKAGKLTMKQLKNMLGVSSNKEVAKVLITPDQASIILKRNNTNNRSVSRRRVELWKRTINKGSWRLSNDMITFDKEGVLSNGQHRLLAVVETGKSVEVFIGFGVNNFMGMDTGKARSVVDNAHIFDDCDERLRDKNMSIIHKIIKGVYYFYKGYYSSEMRIQSEYMDTVNKYADELIELKEAGLFSSISMTIGGKKRTISSTAVFSAYFLAYMNGVDIDILKHIHDVLRSNEAYTSYDKCILSLRELLLVTTGGGRDQDVLRHTATQDCIYKVCNKSKAKKLTTGTYYYTLKDL